MSYYEIAIGHTSHQSTCVQASKLAERMETCINAKQELYRSIFSFDDLLPGHLRLRKSAAGFVGKFKLDSIILDIDKGKQTDEFTLVRARVFVERLMDDFKFEEEWIQIWFSGTGYHIQIPEVFRFEVGPDMDKIVKATLDTYFPEADTVFYHKAGLIRVGYTINNKSGLYKTPMTWDELKTLDVEAIKVLASKPRRDLRFKRVTVEPFLHELIQTAVVTGLDLKKIPMDQPGKVVTCVQTMYSRGEEIGTRHLRMMAMVSSWRRSGIPLAGVIEMLKGWAPSLDEAEIIRHATDIYNKGYQYGCDHKQMKEFCSPTCNYYANKDYSADVLTGKDMEKQLVKMARTSYKDRGINLKDVFEIDKDFWIYPGYTVNIIGDTGLNKTAFCQNLALAMGNLSPVLYCSTEFSNIMLFRRFTQIAHDMTKEQVMAYYAEHDNTLSNAFSHIHYLEVVPNIDEVRNLISRFSPKVVFIDTIDDITVKGQKGLDAEVTVATQMKIMAEALDTIIVYVHHIRKDGAETTNREGEVKSKALSLRDGKGSGAYNQKADVVLAIEGDRNQTGRKVSVLKARDDMPFRIAFNVDMDTFKFNQIIL